MKTWGDFNNFIVLDYEFRGGNGNPQEPICYVFKNLITGITHKQWLKGNEKIPSYPIDKKTLVIAYFASAELGCHQALNFKNPLYILDLYAEFRCLTNGEKIPCGNSLLGACAYYGINNSDATYKDSMRDLILKKQSYTKKEKHHILDYCEKDVELTATLFKRMKPHIDLPYALLRGRYMKAVSFMEYYGVPIDVEKLKELKDCWEIIKEELIWKIDQHYDVYEGTVFKIEKFKKYLEKSGIPWECTETGMPKTDIKYMREQAKSHPELRPLQELRHALSQLKLNDLQIGDDGRNRCLISPFRSKTGRNQPSTSKFIFGNATWVRHLIKPKTGTAIAYVDYEQQELAIAAVLSGDKNLINDYKSGDPYIAFAKAAGAIPPDGTKETHSEIRETYKRCMLAVNYGMSPIGFAGYARISIPEAKLMIKWHKRRYSQYWEWITKFIDTGILYGLVKTRFNWYFQTTNTEPRTLQNWPMQSHGSEILRLAISMCIDNGVRVLAPVHDAILIEAPIERIDEVVKKTQYYMKLASKYVLDFEINTDVKIVKYPDNFFDPRGKLMWNSIWDILNSMNPAEKKARLLEKFSKDLTLDTWNIPKVRRDELSVSEQKTLERIKEKSKFSDLELKYLVQEARDYDFDLEEEVDWGYSGYKAAKETIQKGINPTKKKSVKDLVWETEL